MPMAIRQSAAPKGGRQPTGPDGNWLEPLVFLTAVAATTTRIRLGTAILLAALRRPAVLAKQLATMDVLSGGRVDLGVGVGWQREEYDAVGLSFEKRGRLLDHTLEVCQLLWTQQRAVYNSPELSFDGIHQMPKPLQPGGIPIWISGTVNKRVARRLSKFGTRWIPWGPDIANLEQSVPAMKQAIADVGGDPSGLEVQGTAVLEKTPTAVSTSTHLLRQCRSRWRPGPPTSGSPDHLRTIRSRRPSSCRSW